MALAVGIPRKSAFTLQASKLTDQPVDIVKNTTSTEMIWHTPKKDAYPEGTSL
jgi:hypothetical protein